MVSLVSQKKTFVLFGTRQGEIGTENPPGERQVAYYRRWSNLLSCLAAKAFASLLERRSDLGGGGRVPSVCTRCLVTPGTRCVSERKREKKCQLSGSIQLNEESTTMNLFRSDLVLESVR